jgi:hypothetical protein
MKSEFEANHLLQGGIQFALPYKGNERIFGLDTLTLVFSAPAGTVTFDDASGAGLLVKDVINQINDDVATLRAFVRDGVLYVREVAPSASVVLDLATSTAVAAFGLKTTGNLSGIYYAAPDGVAPRLISFADTGSMDGFTLLTEEA